MRCKQRQVYTNKPLKAFVGHMLTHTDSAKRMNLGLNTQLFLELICKKCFRLFLCYVRLCGLTENKFRKLF